MLCCGLSRDGGMRENKFGTWTTEHCCPCIAKCCLSGFAPFDARRGDMATSRLCRALASWKESAC